MKAEVISSFNVPPPDYQSAVALEDNPIYDADAQAGPSSHQLPQNSNLNPSAESHLSQAPMMLNRPPSLPGDQVSVVNPLFQLDDQSSVMSVDYATVARRNAAQVHSVVQDRSVQ